MKRFPFYTLALAALLLCNALGAAAQTVQASAGGQPVDVNKIISTLTAKETEFRRALNSYAFKRDAVIQVIGMGGQIAGEYHRVSHFTFDSQGNRYEKIVFFPMPTYAGVTAEDIEDLSGVNPFALEARNLGRYNFAYVGRERIDELNLYVFDVTPKSMPKKVSERLFQGRVWVDEEDLQIVKVRGKGVPEGKQRFPIFETYREQIDGKYWFPTYTYADDELVFDSGYAVRIRMKVRYTDFKRFQGRVRVIEEGDPGDVTEP